MDRQTQVWDLPCSLPILFDSTIFQSNRGVEDRIQYSYVCVKSTIRQMREVFGIKTFDIAWSSTAAETDRS